MNAEPQDDQQELDELIAACETYIASHVGICAWCGARMEWREEWINAGADYRQFWDCPECSVPF